MGAQLTCAKYDLYPLGGTIIWQFVPVHPTVVILFTVGHTQLFEVQAPCSVHCGLQLEGIVDLKTANCPFGLFVEGKIMESDTLE